MIINMKPELLNAIIGTGISASEDWPTEKTALPYATVSKASGTPESFADDEPYEGTVEYYVYVWSKKGAQELQPAARKIEQALKTLGWLCTFDNDGFADGAHQLTMRFKKDIVYEPSADIPTQP